MSASDLLIIIGVCEKVSSVFEAPPQPCSQAGGLGHSERGFD